MRTLQLHTTSYWRSIVTKGLLYILRYSMSKNVVTLKSESEVIQGHWKLKLVPFDGLDMASY